MSGKSLDHPLQFRLTLSLPSVRVYFADEPIETVLTLLVKPALCGAQGEPVLPSDPSQRDAILDVQPQELEPLKCASPILL